MKRRFITSTAKTDTIALLILMAVVMFISSEVEADPVCTPDMTECEA